MVVRWYNGTNSSSVDDGRRRWRPGRSDTGTSWFKYINAMPWCTRYAISASLKFTHSGRRSQCSIARISVRVRALLSSPLLSSLSSLPLEFDPTMLTLHSSSPNCQLTKFATFYRHWSSSPLFSCSLCLSSLPPMQYLLAVNISDLQTFCE